MGGKMTAPNQPQPCYACEGKLLRQPCAMCGRENEQAIINRLREQLSAKEKENEGLKEAAEMEFQRAEGKLEMKRWFQIELTKKDIEIESLRQRAEDYERILIYQAENGIVMAREVLAKHSGEK